MAGVVRVAAIGDLHCSRTAQGAFQPLFAKIAVNGAMTHPLYRYLKSARRGFLGTKAIKWNFTKFLIDRDGDVVRRFGPMIRAERIEKDLLRILAERTA